MKQAPTKSNYPYPSRFGSHRIMAKVHQEGEEQVLFGGTQVMLEDEFGTYLTEKSRLDNGLADPNRYAASRIARLLQGRREKDAR